MLDLLFVLLPGRERLIATAQPDETFGMELERGSFAKVGESNLLLWE